MEFDILSQTTKKQNVTSYKRLNFLLLNQMQNQESIILMAYGDFFFNIYPKPNRFCCVAWFLVSKASFWMLDRAHDSQFNFDWNVRF